MSLAKKDAHTDFRSADGLDDSDRFRLHIFLPHHAFHFQCQQGILLPYSRRRHSQVHHEWQ